MSASVGFRRNHALLNRLRGLLASTARSLRLVAAVISHISTFRRLLLVGSLLVQITTDVSTFRRVLLVGSLLVQITTDISTFCRVLLVGSITTDVPSFCRSLLVGSVQVWPAHGTMFAA